MMLSTYAKGLFNYNGPTWRIDSATKHIQIVGNHKIVGKIPLYYFPAKLSPEFNEQSVPFPKKDGLAIPYRKSKWGLDKPHPYHFGLGSTIFMASPELVIIKVVTSGQKKEVVYTYSPNENKSYDARKKEQEFEFTRYFAFAQEDKWVRLKDNQETLDRITMAMSIDTLTGMKHQKQVRINYFYEYAWVLENHTDSWYEVAE